MKKSSPQTVTSNKTTTKTKKVNGLSKDLNKSVNDPNRYAKNPSKKKGVGVPSMFSKKKGTKAIRKPTLKTKLESPTGDFSKKQNQASKISFKKSTPSITRSTNTLK